MPMLRRRSGNKGGGGREIDSKGADSRPEQIMRRERSRALHLPLVVVCVSGQGALHFNISLDPAC